MINIFGVDPGKTGAIAKISDSGINFLDLENVRSQAIIDFLGRGAIIAIEEQNSHGMGRQSAFNFGRAIGYLDSIFDIAAAKIYLVPPCRWKRDLGLIHASKADSIALAKKLYPISSGSLTRKKDHNRAEALLIARWLMEFVDVTIPAT